VPVKSKFSPLSSTTQIPLDLSTEPASCREDLIESSANQTAIAMIDAWPNWPGSVVILAGPVGSGKSHIANAWLNMVSGEKSKCVDVSRNLDPLIASAEAGKCILVEDAGEKLVDETSLFHLINAVREASTHCLITSRTWPAEWKVTLPDLISRLKAAQLVELEEPDDELLKMVMFKLFSDRQLLVDEKVIDFCVLRMERSLGSAGKLVAAIDAEALSRKSAITRATASKALNAVGMF